MWDAATRQAIVQFRDGSWRLCRLIAWQQHDDGIWLCELRWGVSGRLYQARYVYDSARVSQLFRHCPREDLPVQKGRGR
jgi:hypothetical protein